MKKQTSYLLLVIIITFISYAVLNGVSGLIQASGDLGRLAAEKAEKYLIGYPAEFSLNVPEAKAEINIEAIEVYNDVEVEIREIMREANFPYPDFGVKLAICEASLDQLAVGDHGNSRGLYQINKLYWLEITDEQAFDVRFATEWMMAQVLAGHQSYWACDNLIKSIPLSEIKKRHGI